MNLLEGQVAIVTGAGNGIGAAVAKLLAHEGAQVVVNDLGTNKDGSGSDPAVADRVADELKATGGRVLVSHHDVTVASEANALVRSAIEYFGQLDALINCAGVLGLQNLVTACRAVEFVSLEDADHGLAAVEEARREQSAARQTLSSRLLPRLRQMALRPAGNEARATAASARQSWPRADAETRAQVGRAAQWT